MQVGNHFAGHAATVQIFVNTTIKMAWDTHFVGNLRAINNDIIDMYHLKSLHGILNVKTIKVAQAGDKLALVFDVDLPHYLDPGPATLRITSLFDKVIIATGWNYIDLDLFDESCKPGMYTILILFDYTVISVVK